MVLSHFFSWYVKGSPNHNGFAIINVINGKMLKTIIIQFFFILNNNLTSTYISISIWFSDSSIVCRGVQSPTWKNTVPPKESIPPEMTSLKSQQNFQTCLKSNFLFTPISNIYFKKFSRWLESLSIGRLSLIGTYWYQSINRFINSHLFMHFHKGGLSIDPMIKSPLWEYINKSENHI